MEFRTLWIYGLLAMLVLPIVLAETASLDTTISAEDKARFDEILEPVLKIYNLIKYLTSVIAAIFLLYAGISYMTSGSDPRKREQAKSIATYVVIGLVVIWATPAMVQLLL